MAKRLDRKWRRNNPHQVRWTYIQGAPRTMAVHPPFDWAPIIKAEKEKQARRLAK